MGSSVWPPPPNPAPPPAGPRETDTGWNDPITPADTTTPRETFTHEDPQAARSQEPRP